MKNLTEDDDLQRRGRDCMVVRFMTTYVISAYRISKFLSEV
jgi:hypothetical protein